jgi:hypothetical protein
MSSKINICEIITGHYETLKEDDRYNTLDVFTFVGLPILVALTSAFLKFNIDKDITSLLVNFGSIFTALLLSVMVLVYDQQGKVDNDKSPGLANSIKKTLLHQLYYNISYSIVCSLTLVLLCFIHRVSDGAESKIEIGDFHITIAYNIQIVTPLILAITTTIFINVVMILKRMHALLVSS